MASRRAEKNIEEMRKDVTHDIVKHIKVSPSYKVARFVDQPVLEKTVLHQYGGFKGVMRKADTEGIEKARSTYGESVDTSGRLRVAEVPTDLSIESEYFNRYGHGFYGASPDPMHQSYICPKCGLKMLMDLGVMGETCPRCHALTPLGQLVKDGYYRKW